MKIVLVEQVDLGLAKSIKNFFKLRADIEIITCMDLDNDFAQNSDIILFLNCKCPKGVAQNCKAKLLETHPSLLPAFDSCDAVKDTFLSGVKVGGITFRYAQGNIIAQFPVLIDYNTEYEEYEANIRKTEKMLYPLVLKSVLDNKPFSFSQIMGDAHSNSKSECSGACGSCGGCH